MFNDEILRSTPYKEIIFNQKDFAHLFVTLYDNLYTRFGAFICGIFIAYMYRYYPDNVREFLKTKTAKWITHFALYTAWILLLFPSIYKDMLMTYEVNLIWQIGRRGFFSMLLSWLAICALFETDLAGRFHRFTSMKIFYPYGHLLYSMYLFHYIAVGFVMLNLIANLNYFNIDIRDFFVGWVLLASIVSFLLTTVLALVCFLIVELPIMNLRPK